jgi:hypothetical protein
VAHYQHARLVIKGVWGDVRKALRIASNSPQALQAAQKRGGLRSLRVFGDFSTKDENSKEVLPVGLDFSLSFGDSDSYNTLDQYSFDAVAATYLHEYPNAFDSGGGMGYVNQGTPTTPHFFRTAAQEDGGFPLLENAAFAIRVFIPKTDQKAVFTLARWGSWQIQLIHGSPHIMRLKAAWTQTAENALITLLNNDSPTAAQQDDIDDARANLYEDYTSLSKFGSGNDWFNQVRLLAIFPEPHGIIRLWDGRNWEKMQWTAQLKKRAVTTLWKAGKVTVGTSGPTIYWQFGYPSFAPKGTLLFKPYSTPTWMDEGTVFTYSQVSTFNQTYGGTPDGTDISFGNAVNPGRSNVYAIFTTSNTRYTPFLYAFDALVPAGTRTGSTSTSWDSDDYLDADDNPPILDIQPQHEGEGRRKIFNIAVMDVEGQVFATLGANYDSGQWHVFDYYEGGTRIIHNGLITDAKLGDMIDSAYNQLRSAVASGASIVTLTACNAWAYLDQHVLIEEPKGDGFTEAAHIRSILNLTGTPSGEYSGVSASDGRACGAARAGEDWVTFPKCGARSGDYLRERLQRRSKKSGSLYVLDHGDGWTYAPRSTSLLQIDGHDAEFSSTRTVDVNSYPGRFAILDWIDLEWNLADYANEIYVIGGEDENGEKIVQVSRLNGGINLISALPGLVYAGMPVRTVLEAGDSRTAVDVALDRRSAAETLFQPPVYRAIETFYHSGLFPGALITVDGSNARVVRLSDGSWQEDRMAFVVRMKV